VQRGRGEPERHEGHAGEPASVPGNARKGAVTGVHEQYLRLLMCLQFSLHLNMAEQSMSLFESQKLPIVANVEQVWEFEHAGKKAY
jgi:hypothetical protein